MNGRDIDLDKLIDVKYPKRPHKMSRLDREILRRWFDKNVNGFYIEGMRCIQFELPEDAFAYKMRWK